MSEFSVAGDELKKLLKVSTKQPVSFAYCPGSSVDTDLFGLHRKKSPDIMAKSLKSEGDGPKVAFGMAQMEGKVISLRCERVLPALAKKVKKFLKLNKVMKNVRVLDADGNLLEEDIEDLPDEAEDLTEGDDSGANEAVVEASVAGDTSVPPETSATDTDADPTMVLRGLAARAKAVQPQVMATSGQIGERLRGALSMAVESLRAQDAAAAEKALSSIEQVLARLDGGAATGDNGQSDKENADDQPGAATLKKLQDAAVLLAQRIKALPESDTRTMLAGQVRDLVGSIRDGAVERAISGLRTLSEDLKLAEANLTATAAPDPLTIWTTAKESTDSALSALQSKLRQFSDPDLERIAEHGLNGITEGNQTALMKHLIDFRQAAPADRAKAGAALVAQGQEYRAFLAASDLVSLCEKNPFGVAVDLRGPLGRALDDIDRAVGA